MEQQNANINSTGSNQPVNPMFGGSKRLPNSTAVLVLGICSIFPGCICFGLVGIACSIIALVMAKKDLAAYNSNPSEYYLPSYNNLKAGRVCAIIGLCTSALILIFYVIYFAVIGAAAFALLPFAK